MAIIISKNGKNAQRIERSRFEREDHLQRYLAENPAAMPMEEIKEGSGFTLLDREFPVNAGFIDILGIDDDGALCVIETKLYKNPDKRIVLAQVLDYGASLWRSGAQAFIKTLEQRVKSRFNVDLDAHLESNSFVPEDVRKALSSSLNGSTLRFIILMDVVPDELKDLVLFMNENSNFSIYLIEMEYYAFEGNEVLIPHLFGAEMLKKTPASVISKKIWDEASYMQDIEIRAGKEAAATASEIIKWISPQMTRTWWGEGTTVGAFVPTLVHKGVKYNFFAMRSDGVIEIYFQWLQYKPPLDKIEVREELRRRLNTIVGVSIPENALERRPTIDVRNIIPPAERAKFIATMDWMLTTIKAI